MTEASADADRDALTDPKYYEVVEATWPPASKRRLGPVTLREGQGAGSRVSAASVEGPATEAEIKEAEQAMRAMGQSCLFMIRDGQAELDARQRAMLDFAVKVTKASAEIEESDRAALRQVGFTDRDIWDIANVTGFYNMSNRVASATGMAPNDAYHAQSR